VQGVGRMLFSCSVKSPWSADLTVRQKRENCSRAIFLWLSSYGNMLISRLFGFSFSKAKPFRIQHSAEQTTKPEERCLVALLQTVN